MITILVVFLFFFAWDFGYALVATVIFARDSNRISQCRAELEQEFPGVFTQTDHFDWIDQGFVKLLPDFDPVELRRSVGLEVRAAARTLLEQKEITSPISDGHSETLMVLLGFLRSHDVTIPRHNDDNLPTSNSMKAVLLASASLVHACKEASTGNLDEARNFLELFFRLHQAILNDHLWISHLLVCASSMSAIRAVEAILSCCHQDMEMLLFFEHWIPRNEPISEFRTSIVAESSYDLEPKQAWVQPMLTGISAQRFTHCVALFVANGAIGWQRTANAFMVKKTESILNTHRLTRCLTDTKRLLHVLHQIGNKHSRWSPYATTRIIVEHTEAKTFEAMLKLATVNNLMRTMVSVLLSRINDSSPVEIERDWMGEGKLKLITGNGEISVQSADFLDGKKDSLAFGRSTPFLKITVKISENS